MTSLKNIIAAMDLSAASKHACERAAHLAATRGGSLTLMHTLGATALDDLRRWIGEDAQTQDAVRAESRTRLRALSAELKQRYGLHIADHLATGHPVYWKSRSATATSS
jgi:nucleotide-binding universal stress UspA family protein